MNHFLFQLFECWPVLVYTKNLLRAEFKEVND
jgi:hypothetical protein